MSIGDVLFDALQDLESYRHEKRLTTREAKQFDLCRAIMFALQFERDYPPELFTRRRELPTERLLRQVACSPGIARLCRQVLLFREWWQEEDEEQPSTPAHRSRHARPRSKVPKRKATGKPFSGRPRK